MKNLVVARFHIITTHSRRDLALLYDIKGEFFVEFQANCPILSSLATSVLFGCHLVVCLHLLEGISSQLSVLKIEVHFIEEDGA